jgi:NAD(P)-dependent dehydrogenase (short-subunit alcohol dehydrogenase family)
MIDIDSFRYDGKRVLVVGGATGMGAAAAKAVQSLGGRAVVMDYAEVPFATEQSIEVDLRDVEAVDTALAAVDGPFDAVFSAAGVADGTPGVMRINFIAHRHIIERLVTEGRLGPGSAVCAISSVGGLSWEKNIPVLTEFLGTPDYATADKWIQEHEGTDNYTFSKQVMNCYVARQAYPFLAKGIRINAVCPGPTDTPLARANEDTWLGFARDYREATGTECLTPEDIASVMLFLNGAAATGISGVNLLVDRGYIMSSMVGSFDTGQKLVNMLLGRG